MLSFLLLRGRCRQCQSPISYRYPLVELATAVLWVLAHALVGSISTHMDAIFLLTVLGFLFVAVITTMTDLDWRIIPDEATGLLAILGIATSFANPLLGDTAGERLAFSVIGLAVGGGFVWGIGALGSRLLSRDAMGGGDVKLMAGFGAVVGWEAAIYILFLAAFLGAAVSIVGLARGSLKRGQHIPFGPFLNVAAVTIIFHLISGGEIISLIHKAQM